MDTAESTTKVCRDCQKPFPATFTYFPKESRNRDGLKTHCRTCHDVRRAPCLVDGCTFLAPRDGYCRNHYYRLLHYGDPLGGRPWNLMEHEPTCLMPGCNKPYDRRGLCTMHASRKVAHGTEAYEPVIKNRLPCEAPGCQRTQRSGGYCHKHYCRKREYGDVQTRLKAPKGSGYIVQGYRILHIPDHPNAQKDGQIYEHRVVMVEMLGRPLLPGETVHHKNGNRLDNRPENLELWAGAQPAGQRAVDVLAWARGIIARYAPLEHNPFFGNAYQGRKGSSPGRDMSQLCLEGIA